MIIAVITLVLRKHLLFTKLFANLTSLKMAVRHHYQSILGNVIYLRKTFIALPSVLWC